MSSDESYTTEVSVKKPRKYVHRPQHGLSAYNKRVILTMMKEFGCTNKTCSDIEKKLKKCNPEEIREYVNDQAFDAFITVNEELEMFEFKNLNKWLKYLKQPDYFQDPNNEVAAMYKIMAECENHPPAAEENEIDFKKLYHFIGDVMLGNPPPILNSATSKFLKETFTELKKSIGYEEVFQLRETMINSLGENKDVVMVIDDDAEIPSELDPLHTLL